MIFLSPKYTALLQYQQCKEPSSETSLARCFQLLSTAAAIDADCAKRLAAYDLSEGKFILLFLLHTHNSALQPHELAEKAGVTRGTVTGLLDGLERQGHIKRCHNPHDRRGSMIKLTASGEQLIIQALAEHTAWIATLFTGITQAECLELERLLQKITANTITGVL